MRAQTYTKVQLIFPEELMKMSGSGPKAATLAQPFQQVFADNQTKWHKQS